MEAAATVRRPAYRWIKAIVLAGAALLAATGYMGFRIYRARLDHRDYPSTLGALAPNYLKKVPLDPFSNRPFVYRRKDKGFIVYSVGANRRDDGGVFDRKHRESGDIPWRSEI